MKKGIVLYAFYSSSWIGGLFYIRNIARQLLQNVNIKSKYNLFIMTYEDNKKYYQDLGGIKVLTVNEGRVTRLLKALLIRRYNIKYRYPHGLDERWLDLKSIQWIPDFQDSYYPRMFNQEELNFRKQRNKDIAQSKCPVILSSNACYEDFKKYYNVKNPHVYVVHFVSYIDDLILDIDKEYEIQVLKKYQLDNTHYACVMNQFWQHKNHKVIFEAIKNMVNSDSNTSLNIVMTGAMEDYRNPAYVKTLRAFTDDLKVASHIKILGLIEKKEQLTIMKNAEFVIQPSLFEGWGTVLEDAKVLDKTVLLSDIPVHREQMNEKCILFDPYDPEKLANMIVEEFNKPHVDDIEKGIEDMRRRAKEYSKGFEQMLKDMEGIK